VFVPEEGFETSELKERVEEATEHALEVAEHRSRWVVHLSFTTALIAVLAAIAAYSNEALIQKNEALLAQSKASDQWAYYQAKSVKATVYATQAAVSKHTDPELSQKNEAEARRYSTEEQEISRTAKEFEEEVKKDAELSDKSMEHHHRFAYAVTMFQISIALAAVSALSREKMVWYAGLLVGLIGLLYFADGFWLYF
jgi:hypothetical protein